MAFLSVFVMRSINSWAPNSFFFIEFFSLTGTGNKDVPAEAVTEEPTVSAGMGQEALLALLEARVTDLCAELDTIDPALRDSIFLVRQNSNVNCHRPVRHTSFGVQYTVSLWGVWRGTNVCPVCRYIQEGKHSLFIFFPVTLILSEKL